jgi:pimeloyl-ACP methyl ester carboxylesterase
MSDAADIADADFETAFVTAPDGLKLHVRIWGGAHREAKPDVLPLVCLPGLTRTSADFEDLARALSRPGDGHGPRRVLAMDYRGRGRSDYDKDPKNYNVAVELGDVIAVANALNANPAIYLGTSRGGILTMLLAAAQRAMISAAILNDIGPVIEIDGLMRIKGYVGKLPQPDSFEDGARILQDLFAVQFPRLTREDWLTGARRGWRRSGDGRLVPTYDTRLAQTLTDIDPQKPVPDMWEAFEALADIPLMAIRGANSDLLSARTLRQMQDRHPGLRAIEIPDQGHPPLLGKPGLMAEIAAFLEGIGPAARR